MKQTARFSHRSLLALAGCAIVLILANGCTTTSPAPGPRPVGHPDRGGKDGPDLNNSGPHQKPRRHRLYNSGKDGSDPDNSGPHQTYIVTDGRGGPTDAGPDKPINLIITVSNSSTTLHPGAPAAGCYYAPDNSGPHQADVIAINLLPNPGQATASTPRRVIVVVGDNPTPSLDADTVVVRLPAVLYSSSRPLRALSCN